MRLPEVDIPSGDANTVRQVAGWLSAMAQGLGQVAWRMRAGGSAMNGTSHWCGVASAAYQSELVTRCDHADLAAQALDLSAQACAQYAASLGTAQDRARAAARQSEHLVREQDELDLAWQQYDAGLAVQTAALASPVGSFFVSTPAAIAERSRLESWAAGIAASAARVRADGDAAARSASSAAAQAAHAFDEVSALTTTARASVLRARHDVMVDAHLLPVEDGSFGARLAGFAGALWDDVAQPVDLIRGLVGADGDAGAHWSDLGHGLGTAVTQPGALLGTVVDLSDLRNGDWGHWLGTVGPGALLSAGSAGAYGALRGLRGADLLTSTARVGDELRRVQELLDLADAAQFRAVNGGRMTPLLVPGGGLTAHELAGGHLLDRHVGKDLEALQMRLDTYQRISAASTFADRSAAEQTVAEALQLDSQRIATWLGGTKQQLAGIIDMQRVVGVTVPRGATRSQEATRIKYVLVRNPDLPLGFSVMTAFPYP